MGKQEENTSPLREQTMNFAVRIVELNIYLTKQKHEFVISNQVLKSGTNPGAMTREAANAESIPDFIHKLGIAQKEIGETMYWLELLFRTQYLTLAEYTSINNDAIAIMKML